MKTTLLLCLLLIPVSIEAKSSFVADSLFQLVNYIWVEEANRDAFETNMLVDRRGLAQATVDEGIVEAWHFFRNLNEDGGDYLQVITLSKEQKENTGLTVEVERVASQVLGEKKHEVLSTGKSLIHKMEEEWWFELDRMWTPNREEDFQYMMIGYMQSIPEESIAYQDMERKIWQPAIRIGMNQNLLTGWTMASIGRTTETKDYNYVAIDAFDTEEEMMTVDWNGWLQSAHVNENVDALNAETESVRKFVRSKYFLLIDWAGKPYDKD